jgi:hypothetical protein
MNLYRMTERGLVHWVSAVCLMVAAFCCETVARASDVAEVVGQVSVDSYTDYLQNDLYAHDGNERCFGPQHDLARQRIQERFASFGLTASLHPFVWNGGTYYNVVGVLPGSIRPSEVYIIGAHYDTAAGSPGAWDNASGVAGVLEAARVLSQYAFEQTIVFIAFDREEQGPIGSKAYAEEHRWDCIHSMISLDGIAYRPYQPEHPHFSEVLLLYSSRRTGLLDDLTDALGSYAGLTCVIAQAAASDHVSFEDVGFPAAHLRSLCFPPDSVVHYPSDSVDMAGFMDYDYGMNITQGVVAYLATQARLSPVRVSPDFNGDWNVDIEDLTILIKHWGQDDPAFDIAPPRLGDGIVDVQDLEALMHYWGQEIPKPGLIAHWNLDETDGIVAADGVGAANGTLVGDPVWQPAGGKVNGALQFDGIDDYVSTAFVADPSKRQLSIFAWVKGGAPGQVIISQENGIDWLKADAADGALMTELKYPSPKAKPLASQAVITDDNWHHVGVVWDGSNRMLYVDGIEVAKDAQAALAPATGSLHIAGPANLITGSFWSGVIDDVRIYDQAVKP